MSKGNNNNLKLKIMRTKELLSKSVITRDEKIAHLKKLGLWREYLKEVNAWDEQCLSTSSSLELLLNSNVSWKTFLYASFSFARAVKRHDFWSHVANYGKRPDRLKRKSISVYDFDFYFGRTWEEQSNLHVRIRRKLYSRNYRHDCNRRYKE